MNVLKSRKKKKTIRDQRKKKTNSTSLYSPSFLEQIIYIPGTRRLYEARRDGERRARPGWHDPQLAQSTESVTAGRRITLVSSNTERLSLQRLSAYNPDRKEDDYILAFRLRFHYVSQSDATLHLIRKLDQMNSIGRLAYYAMKFIIETNCR